MIEIRLPSLWTPLKPGLILPGRRRPPARRAQPLRVTQLVGFAGGGAPAVVAGGAGDPDNPAGDLLLEGSAGKLLLETGGADHLNLEGTT